LTDSVFAAFAAPGVAVKATAENAIAAATAIIEIAFMFRLPHKGFVFPSMRAASANTTK
jgi:hypothetical protein